MMDGSERVHVDVGVALVTDRKQRVLLTLSDHWGSFTLPMTRRRRGPRVNEPPTRSALRAATEVMGVPVRLVETRRPAKPVLGRLQSGRQLVDKIYSYSVFHVEPHPDFADKLQIRPPHLWLSPHLVLSGIYEPISESARFILRNVLADFEIPARIQHASVLIFQRNDPERGRQFLLRWSPNWGYALPAKRWESPESAKDEDRAAAAMTGAQRVAREELGLELGTDATITPAPSPEYTTHGVSLTKGAPAFGEATDYRHSLFDGTLRHADKLRSERPLAWVTEQEVYYGWTAGCEGEGGAPSGHSAKVSRTTLEILSHLGLIAEDIDPEIREMAQEWLDEHGAKLG
jgi:hypothetical protein